MLKYHFARVPVVRGSTRSPTELVEQKVHEFAAEGWRLVQVLVEVPATMPEEYLLILERSSEAS